MSKNDKHFALKVIPSRAQFEQEVQCITQINRYVNQHGGLEYEFPYFYAFGSKPWNGNYVSHSVNEPVVISHIKMSMPKVFGDSTGLVGSMTSLTVDSTVSVKPWWLYEPIPTMSLDGGVIVMLCGDFYHRVALDTVKSMTHGVQYWLDIYHKANVLHRDIRLSNIMRFDHPPLYRPFINQRMIASASNSCLQWQLIDFNVGYCLAGTESHILTKIHRDTAQWKYAGWIVQQKIQENQLFGHIEFPWKYSDDDQMLMDMVLRFLVK